MLTNQITNWRGCYDESWQGVIVPASFSHPAKYSHGLIRRIYEHALEQEWIKPGGVAIDPFGGVGLGGLYAMKFGLHWVGNELEPKFVELGRQNIELWNSRFASSFPNWGSAVLLQGDSRNLAQIISEAGLCVGSPPFTGSVGSDDPDKRGGLFRDEKRRNDRNLTGTYGNTPGQLGAMTVGSPPFLNQIPQQDKSFKAPHDSTGYLKGDYGLSPGQLGAMTVGSPPFAGNSGGRGEASRNGIDASLFDRHSGGMIGGMGNEAGNLGNLKTGDFALSVSSPPYLPRDDRKKPQTYLEEYDTKRGYKPVTTYRNHYSTDPANLGNPTGVDQETFWSAARVIVEQCYQILPSGAASIWVVKNFVKNGEIVPFSDQWRQLCEAAGFVHSCSHRAMLVKDFGEQATLFGGTVKKRVQRKSFFRLLAEKKGAPRIDWETVICLHKP